MGWKQYVRSVEAAQRRQQREAARRYRELAREHKQWQKEHAKQQAAAEVAQYETYVELLTSMHTECGDEWNWRQVSVMPPPQAPNRHSARETQAQAEANSYVPGFFAKLFGGAKRRQAELTTAIALARNFDEAEYQSAMAEHQKRLAHWQRCTQLAPRVLRAELAGCVEALAFCEAFEELTSFKTSVQLVEVNETTATLQCLLADPELVPKEELKLTAGGKVSTKEMTASKYWTLYQDHVCSCAIRVARETFAVLAADRCIVNVTTPRVNRSTGHLDADCILAVQFTRRGLANLNLQQIDPSDSMKNFNHRMKFKKASGFDLVEPSSVDEAWVTT